MESAVTRFRSRMRTANENFIRERVAELQQEDTPEQAKLAAMSRYWYNWEEGTHEDWRRNACRLYRSYPFLEAQTTLEERVERLEDVAALPHFHMDGTEPPCDKDVRQRYLRIFEDVINEQADFDLLDSEDRILLEEELADFLTQTRGAFDPDFRHSGICDLRFIPAHGAGETEEYIYSLLGSSSDPEEWVQMGATFLNDEVDVVAGVLLGNAGQWPDYRPEYEPNQWFSFYLYCRPILDLSNVRVRDYEENLVSQEWTWKIALYKTGCGVDYKFFLFDSIADFLEWYASWDERLSEEEKRFAQKSANPKDVFGDSGGYALYKEGEGEIKSS